MLFTVDLFNEGVDLPMVDTILLLRPTESATIFLQQLGRGLRLADDKPCLTVLDFIGAQHAGVPLRPALPGADRRSRRGLQRDVEQGFPTLPAGCHIELDRVAKEIVLANIKQSLTCPGRAWSPSCAAERPTHGRVPRETGLELEDVYRGKGRGWLGLRRAAGWDDGPSVRTTASWARRSAACCTSTTSSGCGTSRRSPRPAASQRRSGRAARRMLHFSLFGAGRRSAASRRAWRGSWRTGPVRRAAAARRGAAGPHPPRHAGPRSPARVRCRCTPATAATRRWPPSGWRTHGTFGAGVRWVPDDQADVFFVTLVKSEAHYSPTTMYADRAISPTVFQWESQSTTSEKSPTGQRYINHREMGSTVHLFVRETKTADGTWARRRTSTPGR